MSTEMILIKTVEGVFIPATEADREEGLKYKAGEGIRFEGVKIKPRNLEFHRKYWAGLIGLAMIYFEPTGGLITYGEKQTLKQFSIWLGQKGSNLEALRNARKQFLIELNAKRLSKVETPEKHKNTLHKWIKVEAGLFDIEVTPTGIIKTPKSINFNSMSESEFSEFYKEAFSVVWRFILSKSFKSEAEAEEAMQQLMDLERR